MRSALVLAVVYANCPGPCGFPPPEDACEAVEGGTFRSIDEHECGLGPDGPVTCRWTIRFDGGRFSWTHSEVLESGRFTCEAFTLTGTAPSGEYLGAFDPATGKLTWDDVEYGL